MNHSIKSYGFTLIEVLIAFTLVQNRFLKTSYLGQHNKDGTMINRIIPLKTLFLGPFGAYKQCFDPSILDSKMEAH
jgi:hypothetical protein